METERPLAGYQILDHTADVGIAASGNTLAEALAFLAKGMFALIADPETIEVSDSWELYVSSTDEEALAVDWLNELLYRYEADGFLPKEFWICVEDRGKALTARCSGEKVDPLKRVFTQVKAATYHGLEVSHDREWRIQVVLDV